jgi:hypothetical protein
MSRTKNNLMDNIEQGLVRYNPATREYESVVTRLTDSELAGQTIGEGAERLRMLLDNLTIITRRNKNED